MKACKPYYVTHPEMSVVGHAVFKNYLQIPSLI